MEARQARTARVRESDLHDALEHAGIESDRELRIENFYVTPVTQLDVRAIPDDLSSWPEWRPGELLDDSPEERHAHLVSYRGEDYAERVSRWTPQTMPPIVIVETGNYQGVGDGRGRVSYAIGMGWPTVPAVRLIEREMEIARPNPPWVDRILKKHGTALADFGGGNDMVPVPVARGKYKELGCGHYGCPFLLPRKDVVLKITSDASEAAFVAAYLKIGHEHPGVVRYDRIVELPERYRNRRTFAIWRQEAHHVGEFLGRSLDRYVETYGQRSVQEFEFHLRTFKNVAALVRTLVSSREDPTSLLDEARKHEDWAWREVAATDEYGEPGRFTSSARRLAFRLRQLEVIAEVMANTHAGYLVGQAFDFYLEQGILLADVHLGNIGEVTPPDFSSWELVITDPGHMVPLDPKWLKVEIPQLYG